MRESSESSRAGDFKAVLHPIRRLPKEILCEIFLSFINEDLEEDEEVGSLDPSMEQWIVVRVSSESRRIALSFPRLWSTIRIVHHDFDLDHLVSVLHVLGSQLQRSGNHGLSVYINVGQHGIEPSHPLLPMLFSTSLRWKDLLLIVSVDSVIYLADYHPGM
ncbi:hypothetical protein C8J56DRAFT_36633 [Mycena floridula]|nr:hypothetical protein C8J56DRAFT_36633 [Mycena floridula]